MTKTIKSDTNLGMPFAALGNEATYKKLVAEQAKAQEDARVNVTEASDRIPQFEAIKVNLTDHNSSMKGEGPVKGFIRKTVMHEYSVAESDQISKAQVTKTSKSSEKAKD